MGRRLASIVGLTTVLLAVMGSAATAQPPTHERERQHKFTETFQDELPCVGPATITVTQNFFVNVTAFEDGRYHVTGTGTGKFTAVPDNPSQPSYKGGFTFWFGENRNSKIFEATFTFRVNGKGSDGSRLRFSLVEHVVIDLQTGETKVEFEKARCG